MSEDSSRLFDALSADVVADQSSLASRGTHIFGLGADFNVQHLPSPTAPPRSGRGGRSRRAATRWCGRRLGFGLGLSGFYLGLRFGLLSLRLGGLRLGGLRFWLLLSFSLGGDVGGRLGINRLGGAGLGSRFLVLRRGRGLVLGLSHSRTR